MVHRVRAKDCVNDVEPVAVLAKEYHFASLEKASDGAAGIRNDDVCEERGDEFVHANGAEVASHIDGSTSPTPMVPKPMAR